MDLSVFRDPSRRVEERLDALISGLSAEDKLGLLCCFPKMPEECGIPPVGIGGEAAHGVQIRNFGTPEAPATATTVFPQPVGMSASFDPETMEEVGRAVGVEARVESLHHPGQGLVRFAPTVDLERDPRWGRNEEAYGEDPFLAGKMAAGYVRGMQGNDPDHLRTGCILKHFYANNVEEGREWKNSSVDPRNKYELYLEPFRRCIEEGGAVGVMTAYNRINGHIGVLNPDVRKILKEQYGLKFAVSDGGGAGLVVNGHHEFGTHAETMAAALKAGTDIMADNPALVYQGAKEAWELGLLTEAEIDEAVRNTFEVRLRLGVYDDRPVNPFARVTEADTGSGEHRAVCLKISREVPVLLKNEEDLLPLDPGEDVAVIGPLGDAWYRDWYGGVPPYRTTLLSGARAVTGREIPFCDGCDRIRIRLGDQAVRIAEDGRAWLEADGDVFVAEDWGEGSFLLKCERTGKYLTMCMSQDAAETGRVTAERDEAYDWFMLETIRVTPGNDGTVTLGNRFHYPMYAREDGSLWFRLKGEEPGDGFRIETVRDGLAEAVETARRSRKVILALGCNPMINAKEEIDRKTLALPDRQQALLKTVLDACPDTAVMLFANYPYTVRWVKENAKAILLSATGSQDMGTAAAEALFGVISPSGRVNQTWIADEKDLPDMEDYDIIRGKRTYRYFDGETLFPFGWGLSYTAFTYSGFAASCRDGQTLEVAFTVTNTGGRTADEVAQVYVAAPESRVPKPLRQLIGFRRLRDMAPGEARRVTFEIPARELRFYDVLSARLMVEEGTYFLFANGNGTDRTCGAEVFVPGEKTGARDLSRRAPADHYDEYENLYLWQGHFGMDSLRVLDPAKKAAAVYRDCDLSAGYGVLSVLAYSEEGGRLEVFVNGKSRGVYEGNTRTCVFRAAPRMDRFGYDYPEIHDRVRRANWEDIDFTLAEEDRDANAEIRIEFTGDFRLCSLKCAGESKHATVQAGVAN